MVLFLFSLMLPLNMDELSDNLAMQPINKNAPNAPAHSKVFPHRGIICFTQEALG